LQNPLNERLLSPLEPLNREHRGNAKILEVPSDEETSVYGGHFGTVFILFAEICIDYLLQTIDYGLIFMNRTLRHVLHSTALLGDDRGSSMQADLAIHARKVDDVRGWFLDAFEGGPSGKLRKYRVRSSLCF